MTASEDSFLLSICIPTYNVADELTTLLESIINQIDPRVEVVISDNGSTDSTPEVLKSYGEKFAFIRYQLCPENRGFAANYIKVGKMASGKFNWFVGSDDEISPNSLDTVIATLLAHPDLDGLLINHQMCDVSMNVLGDSYWTDLNQKSEITTDSRAAFIKYWHYTGFFSAPVLRRDLWNATEAQLPWRENPRFCHMLIGGYILRNSREWGFVEDVCINYRFVGNEARLTHFEGVYSRILSEVTGTGDALRFVTNGDWVLTYKAESVGVKLHLRFLILDHLELGVSACMRR